MAMPTAMAMVLTMAPLLGAVGCAKQGAAPASDPASPGSGPTGMGPTGSGGAGLVAPKVPAELAVPDGNKLTFMAMAKGVQIYECVAEAGGAPAWKLHAPRADLVGDGDAVVGRHYGGVDKGLPAGPYWEAQDGSRVHGARPASVPNPGSIPLLRLEAADTSGTGALARVAFIQRLDTTGGVAPTGACEAGKQTEVPYTAKYYFYAKP
jgi:hypothetical protein